MHFDGSFYLLLLVHSVFGVNLSKNKGAKLKISNPVFIRSSHEALNAPITSVNIHQSSAESEKKCMEQYLIPPQQEHSNAVTQRTDTVTQSEKNTQQSEKNSEQTKLQDDWLDNLLEHYLSE